MMGLEEIDLLMPNNEKVLLLTTLIGLRVAYSSNDVSCL